MPMPTREPMWQSNTQTTHNHAHQPTSIHAQQADAGSHAQHATNAQEQRHHRDHHQRPRHGIDAVHAQAAERQRSDHRSCEAYYDSHARKDATPGISTF